MEYFVANSYSGYEIVETKEKNNKMYAVIKIPCTRCGGTGIIPYFSHVDGGVCLKCGGKTPFSYKEVRAYTKEEKEKLDKRNEKAAKTRLENKIAAAPENKAKNFKKMGLNLKENCVYIVLGDSYSIKDELKASGFKFDKVLGWHAPEELEVPAAVKLLRLSLDNLIDVDEFGVVSYSYEATDIVKVIYKKKFQEDNPTEFYDANIGDRIKSISAIVDKITGFNGRFGWTNVYTFKTENYVFTWFTATEQNIAEGDEILLTGTIKDFKEYNGINQTVLTRCKID